MEASEVEPIQAGSEMSDEDRTVNVAVEALPFWYANHTPETLRLLVFLAVHAHDVPLTQATADYMEGRVEWIKKGKPKPKIRVVK